MRIFHFQFAHRSLASGFVPLLLVPFLFAGHVQAIEVTTLADSGAGSLRDAIAAAALVDAITFAPGLAGQTITLTSGQLSISQVDIGASLSIDASALVGGIIIDADNNSRVMQMDGGAVALHSLTLINGRSADGANGADGDGVFSAFAGDDGADGGGIHSSATLTLTECTIADCRTGNGGNGGSHGASDFGFGGDAGDGGDGGGIWNGGLLNAINCLFAGNSTGSGGAGGVGGETFGNGGDGGDGGDGGGLANWGIIYLDFCDFSTNQTGNGGAGGDSGINDHGGDGASGGGGGGVVNFVLQTHYLTGCTLTANQTGGGGDRGGGGEAPFGSAGNPGPGGDGGGLQTFGSLGVIECTFTGNQTGAGASGGNGGNGGGIKANGFLGVSKSTLVGNQTSIGGSGGGYHNSRQSTSPINNVIACTISGNETGNGGFGGGVFNEGRVLIRQSTITENLIVGGGPGAGVTTEDLSTVLDNSIVANNGASGGSDVHEISTIFTLTGVNLVSSTAGSGLTAGANLIVDPAPLLGPLSDNGGPTQTVLPLSGSSAIDAAGPTDPGDSDQRGFPRFVNGALDIGAVEIQSATSDFYLDTDGDGYANGVEEAIGSNPDVYDPAHPSKLQLGFDINGDPTFTFGYVDDTIVLRLTRSTDLIDFSTIIATASGLSLQNFTDSNPPVGGKAFYRLEATE